VTDSSTPVATTSVMTAKRAFFFQLIGWYAFIVVSLVRLVRGLCACLGTNSRQPRPRAKSKSDESAQTADETGSADVNGAKRGKRAVTAATDCG
jgi:hypothetical protein